MISFDPEIRDKKISDSDRSNPIDGICEMLYLLLTLILFLALRKS